MMEISVELETIRLHVVQNVAPYGLQYIQVFVLQRKNVMEL